MDSNINLKDEGIYSLFIKIAIPSSIGTIFQNLYSIVDSIFAGQMISESALAAIGQIFPDINIGFRRIFKKKLKIKTFL